MSVSLVMSYDQCTNKSLLVLFHMKRKSIQRKYIRQIILSDWFHIILQVSKRMAFLK